MVGDAKGDGTVAAGIDGAPMRTVCVLDASGCASRVFPALSCAACARARLPSACPPRGDPRNDRCACSSGCTAQVYMLWGGNGWIGGLLIEYAHAHSYVIKWSSARYSCENVPTLCPLLEDTAHLVPSFLVARIVAVYAPPILQALLLATAVQAAEATGQASHRRQVASRVRANLPYSPHSLARHVRWAMPNIAQALSCARSRLWFRVEGLGSMLAQVLSRSCHR